MQESASDMEVGESHPLHLRQFTQQLKDQGYSYALPELVRRIIRSIAADGREREVAVGEASAFEDVMQRQCTYHVATRVGRPGEDSRAAARRGRAAVGTPTRKPAAGEHARHGSCWPRRRLGKLLETIKSDMILMDKVRRIPSPS